VPGPCVSPDAPQHLQTVDFGELQVEQDERRAGRGGIIAQVEKCEGLRAVASHDDLVGMLFFLNAWSVSASLALSSTSRTYLSVTSGPPRRKCLRLDQRDSSVLTCVIAVPSGFSAARPVTRGATRNLQLYVVYQ